MKKKNDPVRVPAADGMTPTGERLLQMELQIEIYDDGLLRFGDRTVWKHDKISDGMANLLVMAALAVCKDSSIHRRWATIDRAYVEELEKRAKSAKTKIKKVK